MIKKIVYMLIFFSQILLAMEERELEKKKFLPHELKSKIMLYLVGSIDKSKSLNQALDVIKKQFQADDFKEIFEHNTLFTEKLIRYLHKNFQPEFPDRVSRICLAAKLRTTVAINLLKDEYTNAPKLFISFIIDLMKNFKAYCAIELLEFAVQYFKTEDVMDILTYQEDELGTSSLMYAVQSGNSTLVQLFLNMINLYFSQDAKKAIINAQTKAGVTALVSAYNGKSVNRHDIKWLANADAIIAILENNGAEENDRIKQEKQRIQYLEFLEKLPHRESAD